MIFPKNDFDDFIENGNLLNFSRIQESKRYEFTDDQLKEIFHKRSGAIPILAELYLKNLAPFTKKQLGLLWIEHAKYYVRDGGNADEFFKKAAKELGINEDQIFVERGAGWLISNLPKEFYSAALKWAGVCCDSTHDKYIYAYVSKNSNGEYEFKTQYGRIGNRPQFSEKTYSDFELALKDFNKYVSSKKRQYSDVTAIEDSETPAKIDEEIKKEEVDHEIEEAEKQEKSLDKLSFSSWNELHNQCKSFIGKSDTSIGETIRAIDFIEFRAKTRNDWPHFEMSDNEINDSLATSAIGYLMSFDDAHKNVLGADDLIYSMTKEEYLSKINSIKSNFLKLVNESIKIFGRNYLLNAKEELDISNKKFEDYFNQVWRQVKEPLF